MAEGAITGYSKPLSLKRAETRDAGRQGPVHITSEATLPHLLCKLITYALSIYIHMPHPQNLKTIGLIEEEHTGVECRVTGKLESRAASMAD